MAAIDDYGHNLMPLEYFRRHMAVDPYHFWQMSRTGHPFEGSSHIYPHERWMYTTSTVRVMPDASARRGPARLDMLQAIADAEALMANFSALNSWAAPRYAEAEEVRLVKPASIYARVLPFSLFTKWHNVQNVGWLTLTELQTGVVPVYGAADDATITATVGTALASEVVVTYAGTTIQIRPISVTVTAGVATITVSKWLMGDPTLWVNANAINADVNTGFVATVDVYRQWLDPSLQVILAWEPNIRLCGCLSSTCRVCQLAITYACAIQKNYKIGDVGWQFATWNATTGQYDANDPTATRYPDLAYIYYMHGFPTGSDRYMDLRWQRAVSYFAAALLPDYVADSTSQPEVMYHWRRDMAQSLEGRPRTATRRELNNPFGTKRGMIYAWNVVREAVGE